MRTIPSAAIALLLALAACSSTPVRVDSGAVKARTFSFIDPGSRPPPAGTDTRSVVHAAVQQAITRNMTARGIKPADGVGDVVVAYLLIVGDNVSTTAIRDYFGQGRSSAELQEKAQKAVTSSRNPNLFEVGTLVVDIIDARSFELLQRRYVTRPTLGDVKPEERTRHIAGAVDELFRDIRIAP